MIENYKAEVARWVQRTDRKADLDDFVVSEDTKIKWSSTLKQKLRSGQTAAFTDAKIRQSLYRPFTKSNLYFDRMTNDRVLVFPFIFPTPETETENRVIWLKVGKEWPMFGLMVNQFPDQLPQGGSQCFPFYTYDENGTNRQENITDWALAAFRTHYKDNTITKWDIFHCNYGILHHPGYREKYAANLKRDLPHIPFVNDFWEFAKAGARLTDIHVNYESQPEYSELKFIQNQEVPLD